MRRKRRERRAHPPARAPAGAVISPDADADAGPTGRETVGGGKDMSTTVWTQGEQDLRNMPLPVILVVVDGESGNVLDVRVEQPQFITAMLALWGRRNGTASQDQEVGE